MYTIDQALIDIHHGAYFHTDLALHTLRVEDYQVTDFLTPTALDILDLYPTPTEILKGLLLRYTAFRYSAPTIASSHLRTPFLPIPERELTDLQLYTGQPRHLALAQLEAFLLTAIISRRLCWSDLQATTPDRITYFWQSPADPSLILLRSWFNN